MSALIRNKVFTQRDPRFRIRGEKVYRIETFSDAVFAFSISLLIMSLEVPQTFNELMMIIRGFLPFLATVILIFIFWSEQNRYFRNYGFNDELIVWLNCFLLVVILFYIYPMKFLFSVLLWLITHVNYFPKAGNDTVINYADVPQLVMIFSIGYAVIWFLFFLMYAIAWRRREYLQLNNYELAVTKKEIRGAFLNVCIGLASFFFAAIGIPNVGGYCFFLIPFGVWFLNCLKKRELKTYRAS
ncbi:MAG: TMEM175 family protein [Chitinophagales bacterium]